MAGHTLTHVLVCMLVLRLGAGADIRATDLLGEGNTLEKGCGSSPADIAFILDESRSIWGPHFDKQKEFVKSVIRVFQISPGKTRIAVLTFSDTNQVRFGFSTYRNDKQTLAAIDRIQQRGGQTRTDLALDTALQDVFLGKMRRGVAHVAIVITDGKSEKPDLTAAAAANLRAQDITVVAVGVGVEFMEDRAGEGLAELRRIASEPVDKHVFKASFDTLNSLKKDLAWSACQPPTTTTTTTTPPPQNIAGCSGRRPLDVMFGLPAGAAVYNTNTVLDFFSDIVGDLNISPIQAQAGLIPCTCTQIEAIRLRDHDSSTALQRDMASRKSPGADTYLQLEYLVEEAFKPRNSGRQKAPAVRTAVLVVDHDSDDPELVRGLAAELHRQRVRLLVVVVGPHVDEDEASAMAWSGDYFLRVDDYEDLGALRRDVKARLCDSIMDGP